MPDDLKVDKSKFDALLKKMLESKPLPLAELREPALLAARKPTEAVRKKRKRQS